ncbi:unnamed protein product [Rhizoctonia solani]|uniref:Uncharacterized protein n=1 Tax=Rhizoctonia solani TaxID=456999 RepID=A0A8H3B449_9AGAM|nr:unnamed protein product [Rhizoctonia solani]
MQVSGSEDPLAQPQEARDPGSGTENDNATTRFGSPTVELPPEHPLDENVEREGNSTPSNSIEGASMTSSPRKNNISHDPHPMNETESPDQNTVPDVLDGVSDFFRLLDLVEDRSSGGIVEKIIIDQQSLSKFINLLQPGSYKSVSNINFKALDELSIKPIGVYGSQLEIFKYLVGVGCLDHTCETSFFKPNDKGNPTSVIRSGLYLTISHGPNPAASSKTAYIVYWPEDNTWDDQESAETVSNSLRRNRETFMRFLTKLCDQTIALFSASQAEAFVWERGIQNNVASENRPNNGAQLRMEEFHVLELDEQEDDVIASPGFEISVESVLAQNKGARASDMYLVGGEKRIGILTRSREKEQDMLTRFEHERVSRTDLHQMIESRGRCHLVLGDITSQSLELLAANGLEKRYHTIFEDYRNTQTENKRNQHSTEVEGKKQIENNVNQDKLRLAEEIRHMVRRKYVSIYPTCTFLVPNPLPHGRETSELLYCDYKPGLDKIRDDIQQRKIDQVNNQEFQAFKSKWMDLRDRLDSNTSASEEDRTAWVRESIDGVLGPSDPESWFSKLSSKAWNVVSHIPSKIGGSSNTAKLGDPEFVAQLRQWEQNYACLVPLVRLTCHILQSGMEKFEDTLISNHLDNMVSSEKHSRCRTFEDICARAQYEKESNAFNQLVQSLKQAMVPQSKTVPTVIVESIEPEYQRSNQGTRSTSWLSWSGLRYNYTPPRIRYNIYPFEFTTQDRQQSELDEDHVPTPRIAGGERFNFAIPTNKSIEFAQLVQNKCLLAISDIGEGHTRIYIADNVTMNFELQTHGLITLYHARLGGERCVYAFDHATRFFAIVHGPEDPQVSLLRFDQKFTGLQGYRAPMPLRPWYKAIPEISAACFQTGRSELFLVERSGSVHVFSISAEMIRPAPFRLDPSFINVCSTPDGSCLLVVMGGASLVDSHRLVAFHWDASSLEDQLEGIEASDLPPSETPCVVTRFYGKGRTHVVSFLPTNNLVQSTILQIKQRTTEFAIRSENEGLPAAGIQTSNNSIIDCHLEVWTRFPVVPTITRITPFPISRKPRQLVLVSPIDLPRAAAYYERMISTLRRITQKPVDWRLTSTMVSTTKATSAELLENLSEFKLGSFIVELICLIPIQ